MRLEGSCHCRAVSFSVEAHSPVPYMHCYCSICRKTAGGGGYAINLGADATTLKVRGRKHVGIYHAVLREAGQRATRSPAARHFCRECGSALWLWDPRWPELDVLTRRDAKRWPSPGRLSFYLLARPSARPLAQALSAWAR